MNSSSKNNPDKPDISTLEGKVAFLRGLPFFTDTPLETVRLYAYLCQKEEYPADEPVVVQGDPADRMFLIIDGTLTICEQHRDRVFQLQTLSADRLNYFGEFALLAEFEWFFTARAVTDVTLLSITRKAFRKVMERSPEPFMDIVGKIVRLRIRRFIDQTDYLLENIKEEAWRDCSVLPPQK